MATRPTRARMPSPERRYSVSLQGRRVGILHARGETTRFVLDPEYIEDPDRAVLGLRFEEDLRAEQRSTKRLPPWFSNLLPEGSLRDWIAEQRGVAVSRELELLAEVGHDLPGAVVVAPTDDQMAASPARIVEHAPPGSDSVQWRFSLAGVQMKFSLLQSAERFTLPASGQGGDWIVKLPDAKFGLVPRNEHAMMELARRAGLHVPEARLVHRDALPVLPDSLWPNGETFAFAVRRFDRGPGGLRVHAEDLAQVRGFYPDAKYSGSFETVASLVYRRRDVASLQELARRIAFNVLIRNSDAHLKNWSLLYRNPRVPTLSPVYDLVCVGVYADVDKDLGLRLGGSKRFENVTLGTFAALQAKLGCPGPSLRDVAADTIERAVAAWGDVEVMLSDTPLVRHIDTVVRSSAKSLLRGG